MLETVIGAWDTAVHKTQFLCGLIELNFPYEKVL